MEVIGNCLKVGCPFRCESFYNFLMFIFPNRYVFKLMLLETLPDILVSASGVSWFSLIITVVYFQLINYPRTIEHSLTNPGFELTFQKCIVKTFCRNVGGNVARTPPSEVCEDTRNILKAVFQ